MISSAARLKAARERSGKAPNDVARYTGINVPSYYDLEAHDDEIVRALTLRQLLRLCEILQIKPRSLFSNETAPVGDRISNEKLVTNIQQHIAQKQISIDVFEDRIGFTIGECVQEPEAILEWNVDCLRFVCQEIGVDWLNALPEDTRL